MAVFLSPHESGALRFFKALTIWFALTGAALSAGSFRASAETALTLVKRGADPVEMTLEDLSRLPQATIVTENDFANGRVAYRGPLVRDVLAAARLDAAQVLRFSAANDYFIDIPVLDFRRFDVIIAMEANGEKLSRRDKGPLWMMYPISDHAELREPPYIHRLIWQVVRIEEAAG